VGTQAFRAIIMMKSSMYFIVNFIFDMVKIVIYLTIKKCFNSVGEAFL